VVSVTPHPEHGLGITVDADADENAFVDALVSHPTADEKAEDENGNVEPTKGAAERCGVEVGSMIIAVNGCAPMDMHVSPAAEQKECVQLTDTVACGTGRMFAARALLG
jgi:hypothetical protein